MALLYSIEILVFAFLVYLHQEITIEVFALQNVYRLQLALCAKILQILLLVFISRLELYLEQLGHTVVLLLSMAVTASIYGMFLFQTAEYVDPNRGQEVLFYAAALVLVLNCLPLVYINTTNKKNRELSQKNVEQEVQLQRLRNYEQLTATHEKFKSYQESIDEVMAGIWDMGVVVQTKQGRARQIEQYQSLLFRIHQLKQNFNLSYCTGDEILDVVLSSKGDLALKKNIRIQTDIGRLIDLQYDSEIVGSILINVLDAAIETVEVIADEDCEKAIALSFEVKDDSLCIAIEYPADRWEEIKRIHNAKRVSLRIAKKLTEKIKGEFHTIFEDYYFTINIKLPLHAMSK
jgi:hypothetical protein